MPCFGVPSRYDPRLDACRKFVKRQMIASGFESGSRKFSEVLERRAQKMYRNK